jgi:hypothetical protein
LKKLWWRLHEIFKRLKFRFFLISLSWRNLFCRQLITGNAPLAVSLTSYGSRLNSVYLTIESISKGVIKPQRIVLWIDETDKFNCPPPSILRLIARGLEIRRTTNFGPHKKYYPYIQAFVNDDLPLLTADDDVIYPEYWVNDLLQAYYVEPKHIHCFRARTLSFDSNALPPYAAWPLCESDQAARTTFLTGVSGVLYPPSFLPELRQRGAVFMEVCPKADDIWLNVIALRAGFLVKQVRVKAMDFPEIPGSQAVALWISNQVGGSNDSQIHATYTEEDYLKIRSHIKISTDESH